ncbi:MAG: hypothetical protein NW223_14885 [Hyphomicrobiaceae bacterium]|nr:hypothetical protein [Hyphomicrobiaceae bacterium]
MMLLPATRAIALVTTLAAAGCASHLLPGDAAQVSTVDIVQHIRCEARAGVEEAIRDAAAHGDEKRRHAERIVEVSAIGYDFNFVMEEGNGANLTELSFEKGYAPDGPKFAIRLNGGWTSPTKMRENTRIFRVIDKLSELRRAKCGGEMEAHSNPVHPITGAIGMAEVVKSYVELEILTDLGGVPSDKEIIVFSDALSYTTVLDAGASLVWSYPTSVGTIRLTKAGFSGSARRSDMHTLTVALARQIKDSPDRVPSIGKRIMVARELKWSRMNERLQRLPEPERRFQSEAERLRIATRAVQLSGAPGTLGIRDKRLQIYLDQRAASARNRVVFELDRRRLVEDDRAVASRVLNRPVP